MNIYTSHVLLNYNVSTNILQSSSGTVNMVEENAFSSTTLLCGKGITVIKEIDIHDMLL